MAVNLTRYALEVNWSKNRFILLSWTDKGFRWWGYHPRGAWSAFGFWFFHLCWKLKSTPQKDSWV